MKKRTWGYLAAGLMGATAIALYKKNHPYMMHDIKESVSQMSKNAAKSIENMM